MATGTGTHGSAATSGSTSARHSLCSFWLGQRCFGLDVALVGEVVAVESITPVPKAHSALLGLFNLRGTPVPLVDAASALSLESSAGTKQSQALVVRHGDLVVALAIDRMDSVIESGRGAFTAPSADGEHPVVEGFLETDRGVVTIIKQAALLERLQRLRPVGSDEASVQ
jgi:purine-binding chemotaxis protein CheW